MVPTTPYISAAKPVAELASFWDKAIISWVATDPMFNDKSIYTTFGRTLGPFSKMGSFLVEIFKQYNWRRVAVIASNYLLWYDAAKAIRLSFKENNITITYQAEYDRYPTTEFFRNTMDKVQENARSEYGLKPLITITYLLAKELELI